MNTKEQTLLALINNEVGVRGGPVPVARCLTLAAGLGIFKLRVFKEYSEWFAEFIFNDDSTLTIGLSEDI